MPDAGGEVGSCAMTRLSTMRPRDTANRHVICLRAGGADAAWGNKPRTPARAVVGLALAAFLFVLSGCGVPFVPVAANGRGEVFSASEPPTGMVSTDARPIPIIEDRIFVFVVAGAASDQLGELRAIFESNSLAALRSGEWLHPSGRITSEPCVEE